MAALVTSIAATPSNSGGTTGAFNSTGGDLVVVAVSAYSVGVSSATLPTDNKGNTYSALTLQTLGNTWVRLFYCSNATVGSGHTVTFIDSASYPAIHVLVFSGTLLSGAFEEQNGATATGTTVSTGSVTPDNNGSVLVTALARTAAGAWTCGSGFSAAQSSGFTSGNNMGGYSAYLIQETAGAINPAWSGSSGHVSTAIAVFQPAAVASSPIPRIMHHRRLMGVS